MITTHIHTRPRPGQDEHDLTETCWCLPAVTCLARSRSAPELPDHVVVDHDGQIAVSVQAEVRGRIVNPIVAALKDACETNFEVAQALARRTEADRKIKDELDAASCHQDVTGEPANLRRVG